MTPCPFLPVPERPLTHDDIHALGSDRTARFYRMALGYAQTMWLTGFPAKALLLVSRALACRLEEVSLQEDRASPYHAVAWIVQNRPPDRFIGNPRLHYQHLASRMVDPHRELRRWRAWACWYLTRQLLPEAEFPADTKQIRAESTVEPRKNEIAKWLEELQPRDDFASWESALQWAYLHTTRDNKDVLDVEFVLILPDQVDEIRGLAHRIWPEVYPSIISMEQIRYMLDKMYDAGRMRVEIREHGVRYALIREAGENVGYVAWQSQGEDGEAFLSKLYVLPDRHGRGLGARGLEWVEQQARKAGCGKLTLRVNKNNHAAIRAYLRAGFGFGEDVCSEIGGGFVMDDYVMGKNLSGVVSGGV